MSSVPIGPGTQVTLRFTLRLASGEAIDSTGERAATFVVGDGSLLPGFEQAMFGLRAGDQRNLEIDADTGFGPHRQENVQTLPRRDFAADITLEEGLIVSFADRQKTELPGVVKRVWEEAVEVDFNHPLAGKDLQFDVEIIGVEQVSNEILRS